MTVEPRRSESGRRDCPDLTTSEALDHTLRAYGRLERKHGDLKRERARYREALETIAGNQAGTSTYLRDLALEALHGPR